MSPLEKLKAEPLPQFVSAQDLADVLGISTSALRRLVQAGILVKVGHGTFDLVANVSSYTRYRMDLVGEKFTHPDDPLVAEQLRRMKRENDKAEADAVPVEEAAAAVQMIVDDIKEAFDEIADTQGLDKKTRKKLRREVARMTSDLDTRHTAGMRALLAGEDVVLAIAHGGIELPVQ